MGSLEGLINTIHQYRRFKKLFNLKEAEIELKSVKSATHYKVCGVGRLSNLHEPSFKEMRPPQIERPI